MRTVRTFTNLHAEIRVDTGGPLAEFSGWTIPPPTREHDRLTLDLVVPAGEGEQIARAYLAGRLALVELPEDQAAPGCRAIDDEEGGA